MKKTPFKVDVKTVCLLSGCIGNANHYKELFSPSMTPQSKALAGA